MPVTVQEQWGRRLARDSGDIYYLVLGTADSVEAYNAVMGAAPASLRGLPRKDVDVREIPGIEGGGFTGVARYARSGAGGGEETPTDSFRFDTTGGTEHVTMALQHVHTYPRPGEPGTPADFGGAIGVNGETAEGVSIVVPKFGFSIVKYFEDEDITAMYIGSLYHLTGRTNNANYSFTIGGVTTAYAADELLFLGVTGAKNNNTGYWELTFNFAASPNEAELTVGPFTISKKGWEYVWARMEKREDAAAKQVISKPVALHVERVYKKGNFNDLGL